MADADGHDIIVVGASAGGVQALMEIAHGLPPNLPASLFVVVHTSPTSPGLLPEILDRAGELRAKFARQNEPIKRGVIYVAPPDHHLLLGRGGIQVTRGPKENGFRPAVDPLFRSAGWAYGPRAIGVILSGGLDDGTEGLGLIKSMGGITIVQDPREAVFPSMPASAARHVKVDFMLPVAEIPAKLAELSHLAASTKGAPMSADANPPRDVAEHGDASLRTHDLPGSPSGFTCPECGGALWEVDAGGKQMRFRCHVGHVYTGDGLTSAQVADLEAALWSAVRALEENAALRRRMAQRARGSNWGAIAPDYEKMAAEAVARADIIRRVLEADGLTESERRNAGRKADNGRAAEAPKVRKPNRTRGKKRSRRPQ